MNRLYQIQQAVLRVIAFQADVEIVGGREQTLDWERIHAISTSRTALFLAQMRGQDAELAACAAAVHDFGRIITGKQTNHAEVGYVPVRRFLKNEGVFTDNEIAQIAQAVRNHSSKTVVGSPLEEIVKDADVIDCYTFDCVPPNRPEYESRYTFCLRELEQLKGKAVTELA